MTPVKDILELMENPWCEICRKRRTVYRHSIWYVCGASCSAEIDKMLDDEKKKEKDGAARVAGWKRVPRRKRET